MAEQYLRTAIELRPDYFDAYKWLDYTLMNRKDWDTILALWDQYLTLKPDDAEAYFERAGTYYHKKDMVNHHMNDLRKACSLGHKKACQRLKKSNL